MEPSGISYLSFVSVEEEPVLGFLLFLHDLL